MPGSADVEPMGKMTTVAVDALIARRQDAAAIVDAVVGSGASRRIVAAAVNTAIRTLDSLRDGSVLRDAADTGSDDDCPLAGAIGKELGVRLNSIAPVLVKHI